MRVSSDAVQEVIQIVTGFACFAVTTRTARLPLRTVGNASLA
jgi:hypothetical protein